MYCNKDFVFKLSKNKKTLQIIYYSVKAALIACLINIRETRIMLRMSSSVRLSRDN